MEDHSSKTRGSKIFDLPTEKKPAPLLSVPSSHEITKSPRLTRAFEGAVSITRKFLPKRWKKSKPSTAAPDGSEAGDADRVSLSSEGSSSHQDALSVSHRSPTIPRPEFVRARSADDLTKLAGGAASASADPPVQMPKPVTVTQAEGASRRARTDSDSDGEGGEESAVLNYEKTRLLAKIDDTNEKLERARQELNEYEAELSITLPHEVAKIKELTNKRLKANTKCDKYNARLQRAETRMTELKKELAKPTRLSLSLNLNTLGQLGRAFVGMEKPPPSHPRSSEPYIGHEEERTSKMDTIPERTRRSHSPHRSRSMHNASPRGSRTDLMHDEEAAGNHETLSVSGRLETGHFSASQPRLHRERAASPFFPGRSQSPSTAGPMNPITAPTVSVVAGTAGEAAAAARDSPPPRRGSPLPTVRALSNPDIIVTSTVHRAPTLTHFRSDMTPYHPSHPTDFETKAAHPSEESRNDLERLNGLVALLRVRLEAMESGQDRLMKSLLESQAKTSNRDKEIVDLTHRLSSKEGQIQQLMEEHATQADAIAQRIEASKKTIEQMQERLDRRQKMLDDQQEHVNRCIEQMSGIERLLAPQPFQQGKFSGVILTAAFILISIFVFYAWGLFGTKSY